jgi:glycosyltransferase involved in cell wall biosynthesis
LGKGEPDLVSVIIPTYNRARLLAQALESVHAQTHAPLEMIVVDDGSTDDTEAIARKFGVCYIRQERAGAAAARNRGVTASHGQFLQFLDSDDLLSPRKIEQQVAYLRDHDEARAVYGDSVQFHHPDPNHIRTRLVGTPRDKLRWHLANLRALCLTAAPRWRRRETIGPWDCALSAGQEWDYILRALVRCTDTNHFAYDRGAPVYHRIHRFGSITSPKARDFDRSLGNALYLQRKALRLLQATQRDTRANATALYLSTLSAAAQYMRLGLPEHAHAQLGVAEEVCQQADVASAALALGRIPRLTGMRGAAHIWFRAMLARALAQRVRMSLRLT